MSQQAELFAAAKPQARIPGTLDIRAQGEAAVLMIYGDIGGWDEDSVQASQFVDELVALDVSDILVRVNSYGGSVKDGLAIYNALRQHRATVTVQIDGVAASMASVIAMAGDNVTAAEASLVMVHAPWGLAIGNATELRELADTLDKFAEAMVSAYAPRTGAPQARDWLLGGSDVWFTAAEAIDAGLVDQLVEDEVDDSLAAALWNRYGGADAPLQMAAWVRAHRPNFKTEATMPTKQDPKGAPAKGAIETIPAAAATADPAPAPTADVAQIEAAAAQRATSELLARQTEIRALCDRFADRVDGIGELREELLASADITVDGARERILDLMGSGVEPAAGAGALRTEGGEDVRDKLREGVTAALMMRAGIPGPDGKKRVDHTNQFLGMSLLEIVRACLKAGNVVVARHDKHSIVAAGFTHTSSDFPNILENIAEKELLRGWEENDETFRTWTRAGNLPDFKEATRVDLNLFPTLLETPDGAEIKYGTVGDRGERIKLATFSRMVGIGRQTIINDDLDAFTRLPRRAGRAAARTVGNLALNVITSNEVMADGNPLFDASHNNIGTAGIIETSSVDELRVLLATQKDPEGHATGGLNIQPSYLLVPTSLRGAAMVVLESEVEVAGTASTQRRSTVPNSVRGIATAINDARLDGGPTPGAWYMLADPNAYDTIEVAYLDGVDTPFLDTQEGWNRDGVELKARIDAAAKALDWRTMARNDGA